MELKTLEKIKELRSVAGTFAGFHELYSTTYAPDSGCDKKGYGFGKDDRFAAFEINTTFSSWAGYYGNSSCSKIMSVRDKELVKPFVIKALNVHQKEIFETVARLMREEAASLTGKAEAELTALRSMLDDAKLLEAA